MILRDKNYVDDNLRDPEENQYTEVEKEKTAVLPLKLLTENFMK